MNNNLIGSLSIAGALVLSSVVAFLQSSSAIAVWQDQVKNEAIDGCAAYSSYTATSIKDEAGREITATDEYPISWIFDECLNNKGVEYERTDFSQVAPAEEAADTELESETEDSTEASDTSDVQ